jgi:hypothetical protein
MIWTAPWALAGLLLLAGPLLVHMLLRRNARRLIFPTTRFLPRTRASAVRFRRPSDVGLLILRAGIVLAAVLACAQPVLLSSWRTARWNQRTARAVVVDTSRSVPATPETARLADQELQAFASATFRTRDVREGLRRATDWLSRTPPARREIVIVSDFQRGALDAESLAELPAAVGLRFIRVGAPAATGLLPKVVGWRHRTWEPQIALRGDAVDVTYTAGPAADGATARPEDPPGVSGFLTTRQPVGEEAAAAAALAGAASFGTLAIGDRRAVVAFAGAPSVAGEQPLSTPWMSRAALDVRRSPLLRETGAGVTFAEKDGAFVVHTDVRAASASAAAAIRAVMLAVRPAAIADPELETATIPDADLAAWRRTPGPIEPGGAVVADGVESRWLWSVALALLAVEAWVRSRRSSVRQEVHADAA